MNKKYLLCATAIALLVSSLTSNAENRANSATFTLGDGGIFFANQRHLNDANIPFAALGYNFTDHWGIEGWLGYFKTTLTESASYKHRVEGTLFSINGVYHFIPQLQVQPYVLAGVGVLGLNDNGDDAHNVANVNGGAGVLMFINHNVAFRVEGRDFYTMASGRNDLFASAAIQFYWDLR